MNNKGLAISGILYTILLIFIVAIAMMLFNLQNRKTILDELKADAVDAVESDNNYEYLLNEINTLKETKTSIDKVYPIGSIYMSTSNTNPGTLFPGTTWEAIKDRFLVGAGTTYPNGKTGGTVEHQHELPIFKQGFTSGGDDNQLYTNWNGTQYGYGSAVTIKSGASGKVVVGGASGSKTAYPYLSNSSSNLPPYLAVYMWKRTS